MTILLNCIAVLAGVIIANKLSRILKVPGPLMQIAIGWLIASQGSLTFEIHPETFMFVFLASLLFLDGHRLPFQEVKSDGFHVISLAFGLVVVSALGLGYVLNLFLPEVPLAVCVGLAAIISLTDPIAVASIAQRAPIPKRMMHILEGESLVNDATGLVCLRFAITAATTGVFLMESAVKEFTIMVVWGLVIGVATTLVLATVSRWFAKRFGEVSYDQIIITLLAAFGSFWIAEHWHASGVLASVAAGVTMNFVDMRGTHMAETRVQRKHFWDTIQYCLNGAIFILMGEQMPSIIKSLDVAAKQAGHENPAWLLVYIVAIMAFLIIFRFIWCHITFMIEEARLNSKSREAKEGEIVVGAIRPTVRASMAMSFAGVRGAITLAGIMSMPVMLPNGLPFPGREFAIVTAVGVIILSLILSALVLPSLLKGLEFPELYPGQSKMSEHDREAALRALTAIEDAGHALAKKGDPADVALIAKVTQRLSEKYQETVAETNHESDEDQKKNLEREQEISKELAMAAIEVQRGYFFGLNRANGASDHEVKARIHDLDLAEARMKGAH